MSSNPPIKSQQGNVASTCPLHTRLRRILARGVGRGEEAERNAGRALYKPLDRPTSVAFRTRTSVRLKPFAHALLSNTRFRHPVRVGRIATPRNTIFARSGCDDELNARMCVCAVPVQPDFDDKRVNLCPSTLLLQCLYPRSLFLRLLWIIASLALLQRFSEDKGYSLLF